ncbi:hypothetical protein GIB67_035754 [Kingdonia uniflora]|uniref:Tubby C-terminal domain-containing protein n=1 Tax=Kingdonia uniflora TaxID=39325 RepID=A0A7J7MJG9_9MAGN|nr:hypothetical protein GIB67_035754 [Kingdonia uniflora]
MNGFKKSSIPRQSSYNSLYVNPLNELKHNRNNSESDLTNPTTTTLGLQLRRRNLNITSDDKENAYQTPNKIRPALSLGKENVVPLGMNNSSSANGKHSSLDGKSGKSASPLSGLNSKVLLKSSSLQLCVQLNESDSTFGLKLLNPLETENLTSKGTNNNIWNYSDSESEPASSWSILPNRSLLCRPLPLDIGRCTCVIVKESLSEGLYGGSLFSLYTNEGQGRKDRKLAVAHHRRRSGRSEFIISQKEKGLLCSSDENFLGSITANFMGSKYHIWDQVQFSSQLYIANILIYQLMSIFVPTLTTCTGCHRSLTAWIPKHQSMQLKSTNQIQHINGLPKDWEAKADRSHQLLSRVPHYNNFLKRYELDFRDRGRTGLRIRSSVKNFQLTIEENGRQPIVQLGRVGKSKYVMDYRYPLTGYQAFCICLASIDSKLCCTM